MKENQRKRILTLASLLVLKPIKAGLSCCGDVATKEEGSRQLHEIKKEKQREVQGLTATCNYTGLSLGENKNPIAAALNGAPYTTPLSSSDTIYAGESVENLRGVTKYQCEYDSVMDTLSILLKTNDNILKFKLDINDAKHAFLASQEIWSQGVIGTDYVVTVMGSVVDMTPGAIKKRFKDLVNVKDLSKQLGLPEKTIKEKLRLGQIPVVQFHFAEHKKIDSLNEFLQAQIVGLTLFVTEFSDGVNSYSHRYSLRLNAKDVIGDVDIFSYGSITSITEVIVIKDIHDPKISVRNDWDKFQDRVQSSINQHQALLIQEKQQLAQSIDERSLRSVASRQETREQQGVDKTGTSFIFASE